MIKVCDAIMGSGKSSAAITFINSNPDRHYIYIAPYLDESQRIAEACHGLGFVEPSVFGAKKGVSKVSHIRELLEHGCNISSTQQAIPYYTEDMFDMIHDKEYTVIIDEVVDVFDDVNKPVNSKSNSVPKYNYEISANDVDLLVAGGYLKETKPGEFHHTGKEFTGLIYEKVLAKIKTCPIVQINNEDPNDLRGWKWVFPKRIFESAKDVYILTYMFDCSQMALFFRINNLDYIKIGVSHPDRQTYCFCDHVDYIPDYVNGLPDMIDICDNKKMNAIGEKRTALSMHWYDNYDISSPEVKQLKNNLSNYYLNILSDIPSCQRMTGIYESAWPLVKTKGCGKKDINFVVFNQKSQNKWGSYTALSYMSNVFLNPNIKNYFSGRGEKINEDEYALSTLIQWIWRSAIRNGKQVHIYIPSKRMRNLLIDWIDSVSRG